MQIISDGILAVDRRAITGDWGSGEHLRFPDTVEIPLSNPPLAEVICQVRFSPILKIAASEPIELQDRIRHLFPNFGLSQDLIVQSVVVPDQLRTPIYSFETSKGSTKASLAVNFFGLSTTEYDTWEVFREQLDIFHNAVMDIYQPTNAGRVGLRYLNRIEPANSGLDTVNELASIIRDDLVCPLITDAWNFAERLETRLLIPGGDERLSIRLTIDPEPHVLLDLDYFEAQDGIPLDALTERCDHYHDVLYSAFRWCMKEEGLARFGPEA